MNIPQNNKPSLKELFDSKKFDQPSDEFWDEFQSAVRSKTLSSVARESSSRIFRQKIYLVVALFSVSLSTLHLLNIFDSKSAKLLDGEKVTKSTQTFLPPHSDTDFFTIEGTDGLSFDLGHEVDKELFVDRSYRTDSFDSTFHNRVLTSNLVPVEDFAVPFSF